MLDRKTLLEVDLNFQAETGLRNVEDDFTKTSYSKGAVRSSGTYIETGLA